MKQASSTISILIIAVVLIIYFPAILSSKVTGLCSNCHTMHYSQNGTQPSDWEDIGPYEYLLTNDCLGCHSASDGSTWKDPITGAPIVYNALPPTYGDRYGDGPNQGLAAGNFYWVEHVNDNRGHNIFPGNPDDNLNKAPGSYAGEFEACGTNNCHANLDRPFQNSPITNYLNGRYGCQGCHMVSGFNQFSEKKVWHHSDDSDIVIDSAEEGWFRFLSGHISGNGYGVSGIEDEDWQYTYHASDHNEYLGAQRTSYSGNFNSIQANTMTAFCCGCHGKFHEKKDKTSGNWVRHPVDKKIPITSGFENYSLYDPLIPVGRPSLAGWIGPSPVVNEGGAEKKDMVMCLSCHRVHGSPYPDMLRWDYDTMVSGKGCFTCHTLKDTG